MPNSCWNWPSCCCWPCTAGAAPADGALSAIYRRRRLLAFPVSKAEVEAASAIADRTSKVGSHCVDQDVVKLANRCQQYARRVKFRRTIDVDFDGRDRLFASRYCFPSKIQFLHEFLEPVCRFLSSSCEIALIQARRWRYTCMSSIKPPTTGLCNEACLRRSLRAPKARVADGAQDRLELGGEAGVPIRPSA